jgi:hypothetical protein
MNIFPRITSQLIRLSRRWWLVLSAVAATFVSLQVIFFLDNHFRSLTGQPVFDTQNELTSATLLQQLPLYIGEAKSLYIAFTAFDYVFPFVASVFIALLWALFLRLNTSALARAMIAWHFPAIPFVVTLADYGENICLLSTVLSMPTSENFVVLGAIAFKKLKLVSLALIGMTTLILAIALAINVITRRLSHSKDSTE